MKYFLRIIICCSLVSLVFNTPELTKAYSPIVASCSNGVLDNTSLGTSNHKVEQLFEIRLDQYYLDAVSVRVMALDEPSLATITVTDRDHAVIASKTQMVPMEESWVYIDLDNVPMPRAVYLLRVSSGVNDPINWKYAPGNCIADSHAMIDDVMQLDKDMGFGVYAYDNSAHNQTSAPASNSSPGTNPAPNNTLPGAVSTSNSSPAAVSTTAAKKTTTNTTPSSALSSPSANRSTLSDDEILKMAKDGQDSGGMLGSFAGFLLLSPLMSQLFSFLIFIGLVFLIIKLLRRRRKDPKESKGKQSD